MKRDILTLIEGDIVNTKLINALIGIGINAEMYYVDSSEVMFHLLGVKEPTDELYESYYALLRLGEKVDCSESLKEARELAEKIYGLLRLNRFT